MGLVTESKRLDLIMKKAEIPANELARISALCGLEILDTPSEERFDRITRIAQRHFNVPIALVSLVDRGRQWFKSRQGLDAAETPRDVSFCGHAIFSDDIFYIPDALADERFADNPLVTGAPHVRFYAGAPLHSPEGQRVGTLCIIDQLPRESTSPDLAVLRDLADCVEEEFKRSKLLGAVEQVKGLTTRLQLATESANVGVWDWDVVGNELVWDKVMYQLYGIDPNKFGGAYAAWLAGIHPKDAVRANEAIQMALTGDKQYDTEFRVVLPNGNVRWLKATAMVQRGADGKPLKMIGTNWDITESKCAQSELQSRENRIRALVDTIVDGIIVIDAKGDIQTANPAAISLFGYAIDEIQGKNVKMLMPEPYASEHDGYLNNYLTSNIKKIIGIGREVTGKRKDGTTFPMDLAVGEMEVGGERMFTGIVRDVTERKRLEQLKSEFISTVSHELRTPLTSIRGALSLLMGKAAEHLPEKARRMLEMAERNSERLTLLINDILDLEKIEAGRLEFDFKDLDLVDVAARALEDNGGYASKHQVQLVFDQQVTQAPVRADEHRLLQVFANLISNAVKYSPTGGTVTVSVVAHDDKFCVEVRDHGSGIPQEFRNRIFQRFAQADSSDTRGKGGTGLGLSITKAIIERHEGQIGYESESGMGSVFYFKLPRAGAGQCRRLEDQQHDTTTSICVRALICEDNPDVAQILAEMVRQDGVTCDVAGTAAIARGLLAEHDYRLLLLDLTLPDTDGLTFLRELRGNEATAQLPVIVVSGQALEGRATFNGNAVTVVDWIQKPVDRMRLGRALQDALHRVKRPHILHVEDDTDILEVTRTLLEDMADLTYVTNLREARQQLAAQIFDMVILDLGLPDGSGIELLEELQGRCPVVIFSAQIPSRDVTAQVATALTKSMTNNEELLGTIKKILNLKDTAA